MSPDLIGLLPQSPEAEKALLSSFVIAPREVGSICVREGILEEHFSLPSNATLYRVLMELWSAGDRPDFITLNQRLQDLGEFENCGGSAAISELFTHLPTAANIGNYTEIVLEKFALRQLTLRANQIVKRAMTEADPESILTEARTIFDDLGCHRAAQETSLKSHLISLIEELDGIASNKSIIKFGVGLDNAAGPFQRGDLLVVAGETKSGKSALAGNMIENAASEGHNCLLFGIEMAGVQYAERFVASSGRIDMRNMRLNMANGGKPKEFEFSALHAATSRLSKLSINIVTQATSLSQICAFARQKHAQKPLDVLALDYAQLAEGKRKDGDSREREVASISAGMKRLALELNCVVILLSQLNDDGRLRESRAIGQDANAVIVVEKTEGGGRQIRIGLARSAPTGTVIAVKWSPQFTRFDAIEP